jgi:hypothetical protein
MPYYVVFYHVVEDFVSKRGAFRGEHLRRVSESYERGELILGGALGDPADTALLIFRVDDKRIVELFIQNDPFVVGGLVKKWEIRPWNVVTGNEASAGPAVPTHPTEISRMWTARASKESWPIYREHFSKRVLPELRTVPCYLGATLYARQITNGYEILVETFWRSLDAIKGFAGVNIEKAVVAEEAIAVLRDYDHQVRHYEIVISDHPGATAAAMTK